MQVTHRIIPLLYVYTGLIHNHIQNFMELRSTNQYMYTYSVGYNGIPGIPRITSGLQLTSAVDLSPALVDRGLPLSQTGKKPHSCIKSQDLVLFWFDFLAGSVVSGPCHDTYITHYSCSSHHHWLWGHKDVVEYHHHGSYNFISVANSSLENQGKINLRSLVTEVENQGKVNLRSLGTDTSASLIYLPPFPFSVSSFLSASHNFLPFTFTLSLLSLSVA